MAYTDTEENWIQNQFQLLQDQYTSVVPDKQYFDDLINLLLWNIPVSETFIATWFKMIIERARRVLKIHPGKDCLCLVFKDHPGHGLHSTEVAYLILTQQPWDRFSVFPRVFLFMLMRYLDILTALLRTVDTGKRLDNVNQIHLVLASGKIVLQKSFYWPGRTWDMVDSIYFLSQQQHTR